LKGMSIGKILKSLAYNAVLGLVSFSAGDAIYNSVTSPKSGSTGTHSTGPGAGPTPNTGTPNTGTPNTGTPNTGTPNTGTPNTGPTPNTGALNTGTPNTLTPNTGTPNTGYPTDAPGSISQRAREERALDRRLPVDVFSESLTPNHV
jgi:pentapeptide repeat protein